MWAGGTASWSEVMVMVRGSWTEVMVGVKVRVCSVNVIT